MDFGETPIGCRVPSLGIGEVVMSLAELPMDIGEPRIRCGEPPTG